MEVKIVRKKNGIGRNDRIDDRWGKRNRKKKDGGMPGKGMKQKKREDRKKVGL